MDSFTMTARERIDKILSGMTPTEKIGQLLLIGFEGPDPPGEVLDFIRAGKAGGTILFSRNAEQAEEAADLVSHLRKEAAKSRLHLPFLVAVDQEGGAVVRLSEGVTVFPGNMALGATGSREYAYQSAKAVGTELSALGFNLNLAPVVDVNSNPENPVIGIRSFGEDPDLVSELGAEMIRGYREGGVAVAAKHYPGHGDTVVDSHLGMPRIPHPYSRLEAVELKPFRAAVAAGADCILTAHAAFPAVEPDPELPATLSRSVLSGLLRREIGFTGLIITDCLEMRAVSERFGTVPAAVASVAAGADQVLISHDFVKQRQFLGTMLQEVAKGGILTSRVDEAVRRILALKLSPFFRQCLLRGKKRRIPAGELAAHRKLSERIARESLTLIRNKRRYLPLRLESKEELALVSFRGRGLTMVEERGGAVSGFFRALSSRHSKVTEWVLDVSPSSEETARVIGEISDRRPGAVIIATMDARLYPQQALTVRRAVAAGLPVIVTALRSPYDLVSFPEVETYVAAYGYRPVTLEALAALLWGEINPAGRLPVTIPGLYPAGYGLRDFAQ